MNGKVVGVESLIAIAVNLHIGGSGDMVILHWNLKQQWISADNWATKQLSLGFTLLIPRSEEG